MLRVRFFLILLTFLVSSSVFALDVDEKLTLRILRTSSSKKTVLVNRGIEDGLTEGDHAKFFVTSGVIARGVAGKVSPSRSIWAVYRLIDSEELVLDKVMNLKVTTPVKLSKDRSKMLSPDNTDSGADVINIPLAPGADDTGKSLSQSDQAELAALQGGSQTVSSTGGAGLMTGKNWEVWGLFHLNNMSSSADTGEADTQTGSETSVDISGGIEWYFQDRSSWVHDLSVFILVHSGQKTQQNLFGGETQYSLLEYGGGASYHFLADPFSYNRLISYITFSFGVGTTSETSSTATTTQDPLAGSNTFFSVGAGIKFYLSSGFGFRAMIDYYRRAEVYSFDSGDPDNTRVVAGPRIQAGLSYRW